VLQSKYICPSCFSDECKCIGRIQDNSNFAGLILPEALKGGYLVSCNKCSIKFRYPLLPAETITSLYNQVSFSIWNNINEVRPDWEYITSYVKKHTDIIQVLDVGCSTGAMLNKLPANYKKFGIEINREAQKIAISNGINIVGSETEYLNTSGPVYDCITAIDTIEHIPDPIKFLKCLQGAVRPGGYIIISTSNAASIGWLLEKGNYYYCTNPEHVTFVTPEWCQFAADKLNLDIDCIQLITRFSVSLVGKIANLVKHALYFVSPRIYQAFQKTFGRRKIYGVRGAPAWFLTKDHMVVVFKVSMTAINKGAL